MAHRRETSDGNATVIIDLEDFLLVRGEGGCGALQGRENSVGLRTQSNAGTSLFYSLTGILNLENSPLWVHQVSALSYIEKEYREVGRRDCRVRVKREGNEEKVNLRSARGDG